ncbi:hypothetical protein ACRAWD_28185 [Caulobacter segnis]
MTFEIKPSDLWMWNIDMKRVVEHGRLLDPGGSEFWFDLKKATLTVA